MKTLIAAAVLASATMTAAPALAQDEAAESAIKVTGSVTLASDYRFRGVSQTDKAMAIQGGVTVTHESGLYVGTWASNLSGWGTFGGSNTELDIFGGFAKDLGGVTVDVGLTWYMYPGGADKTDFAEPYVKLSTTTGPVSLLAGVAYAPKQEALGNFSNTPFSNGQKEDNFYIWGDAALGITDTPFKLKAHLGYSDGNPGLGPNGTSVAPTGKYLDWSLGAEAAWGPLTLGVSYIDTDITDAESAYLRAPFGGFQSTKDGSSIAGSTVLVSLTAAF
jgi:uncharacterized protein (TIGR02001 family)